jgi:hypothetical protein
MDYLASRCTLKKGSVKEPDAYLGAEVKKWMIEGADNWTKVCWAMLSDLYVNRAVTEVERELDKVCDADHAVCRVTRRNHTGVLIIVNRTPILWYSKRQNTVEALTFGSEFIAAKFAVEMIEGLRYKLRMMGVQVDGPTNVFCDNESVVKNSTRPESTLKKKHNMIANHRVRKAQAAGVVRIAKEDGETNLADILTKCLPGPRLRQLSSRVLW